MMNGKITLYDDTEMAVTLYSQMITCYIVTSVLLVSASIALILVSTD